MRDHELLNPEGQYSIYLEASRNTRSLNISAYSSSDPVNAILHVNLLWKKSIDNSAKRSQFQIRYAKLS